AVFEVTVTVAPDVATVNAPESAVLVEPIASASATASSFNGVALSVLVLNVVLVVPLVVPAVPPARLPLNLLPVHDPVGIVVVTPMGAIVLTYVPVVKAVMVTVLDELLATTPTLEPRTLIAFLMFVASTSVATGTPDTNWKSPPD